MSKEKNTLKNWNLFSKMKTKTQEAISGYLFISPFYILFSVFTLFSMIYTLFLSFTQYDLLGEPQFVGLNNYIELFTNDTVFWQATVNTLIVMVLSTLPQLVVAVLLAYFLNRKYVKHKGFFQTTFFLPYITSVVAVALIFSILFSNVYGIANQLLTLIGFDTVAWSNSTIGTYFVISLMIFWRYTGYNTMLVFSALQSIPESLYEAADVDGASSLQKFFHITIPSIRPMLIFIVMTSFIGGMQIFAESQIFSGQGGGPSGAGLMLTNYLYEEAFTRNSIGYGSAIAVMLFIFIGIITLINLWLTSKIASSK